MKSDKKPLYIFTDWYLPGYKAGGPVRSVANMVSAIQLEYDIFIITRNTDWQGTEPYSLKTGSWVQGEGCKVMYLAPPYFFRIFDLCKKVPKGAAVYINGFYSPLFNALPVLLLHTRSKLVVAPRGMLKENAIALKSFKKKLFIAAYQFSGISKRIRFHSTGKEETGSIRAKFPKAQIVEIANISIAPVEKPHPQRGPQATFLSVGRISPVKNTEYLIGVLSKISNLGPKLQLVGTTDDMPYQEKCRNIARSSGLHADFVGGISPVDLPPFYSGADFFITTTSGENFGHAIIEALAHGCPVIISDQTPWNDLEAAGAGWVVPLQNTKKWEEVLLQAMEMPAEEYRKMSERAIGYVRYKFDFEDIKESYVRMFSRGHE